MKKFFRISLFVLIGITVIGTFVFLWNKSRTKEVVYEEISPSIMTIQKKTVITGYVEPRDEVSLKPQISGIIMQLYKEAGQQVKAGEAIAKVQVIPDISQLSNAESNLNIANLSYDQAKQEYERNKKLYDAGVISKESYDNYYITYKKAEENVNNAKESIQIIKEGISKNTEKYSNTMIRATISGMILDIPVKVGNSVIQANNFNDGTTIATIANMSDLVFMGKVDETEVGRIKEGNQVNLIIGAMQDASFNAVLEYIAPKAVLDNGARTFDIKAAVENNDNDIFIRSGYSANGEIIIDTHTDVLTIPENCISFSGDSSYVYLLNPTANAAEKYVKKNVEIGISDGINIEIIKGLTLEDKVRGKALVDIPINQ